MKKKKQHKAAKKFCSSCKKWVPAGNFCSLCGRKLVVKCNCWLLGKPYNCGLSKCPDMNKTLLLVLKIQKSYTQWYRIFKKPAFEAIVTKSSDTFYKLTCDKSSVF